MQNARLSDLPGLSVSRRWFLQDCGVGLGAMALAELAGARSALAAPAGTSPLAAKPGHFPAKAKNVIFLFMAGAPSHLELFDNKPELTKYDGKLPPAELIKGYRAAFISPNSKLLGGKFKFAKHGKSGAELSELLPSLAGVVDDVAIVKSMVTDAFNHAPAQIEMNTGSQQFGRPSIGAWVTYGLGSVSQDLPGFIVFSSGKKGPSGGNSNWGAGFLPTMYQGVQFRGGSEPVLFLSNPRGVDEPLQRDSLDALRALNQQRLEAMGDPEIATRINSYEMAFRMQSSAPELMDLSKESKATLEMYGAEPGKSSFANNCLLARRLAEAGAKWITVYYSDTIGGQKTDSGGWDTHGFNNTHMFPIVDKYHFPLTEQTLPTLLDDLQERDMLADTLVVWMGEFGRTPKINAQTSRDHWPDCYTVLFAGGGTKGGYVYGRSDSKGMYPDEHPVRPDDIAATIYHLLGIDPQAEIRDTAGRPLPISRGKAILDLMV